MNILKWLFDSSPKVDRNHPMHWTEKDGQLQVEQAIKLDDQELLKKIASSEINIKWRLDAIKNLKDQAVLHNLAFKNTNLSVCIAAGERLQNNKEKEKFFLCIRKETKEKFFKRMQEVEICNAKPGVRIGTICGSLNKFWTYIEDKLKEREPKAIYSLIGQLESDGLFTRDSKGRQWFHISLKYDWTFRPNSDYAEYSEEKVSGWRLERDEYEWEFIERKHTTFDRY